MTYSNPISKSLWFLTVSVLMIVAFAGMLVPSTDAQDGPSLGGYKPLPKDAPMSSSSSASSSTWPSEWFAQWPKQDPDLVIVLTGQMHAYIQKCGCTIPQKGGLERRANFLQMLRQRGWEVLPVDLGDIIHKSDIPEQALVKYKHSMNALKAMDYKAIGVGIEEFRFQLLNVLTQYSFQSGNEYPRILAGNVLNTKDFPSGTGSGSMLRTWDVVETKTIPVGIVGLVAPSLFADVQKLDSIIFPKDSRVELDKALAQMNQSKIKPQLNILLYQGSMKTEEGNRHILALRGAAAAANAYDPFRLILTNCEEQEPPTKPYEINKSWIIQVGQRGQYVGVVGVFRKTDGSLDLHYERITMSDVLDTPQEQEANHPVLQVLESYAKEIKRDNYLAKYPKYPHPLQKTWKEATFAGTETCSGCHAEEFKIWKESSHSHAYHSLETLAKRPSNRQYDPECIICHTVGFKHPGGFDGSEAKIYLKDVGCENCHGPASLHVQAERQKLPNKAQFLASLSPWKTQAQEALPSVEVLKKATERKTVEEQQQFRAQQPAIVGRVDQVCQTCHTQDTDPKFLFEKSWPKIAHSKPKQQPAPVQPVPNPPEVPLQGPANLIGTKPTEAIPQPQPNAEPQKPSTRPVLFPRLRNRDKD